MRAVAEVTSPTTSSKSSSSHTPRIHVGSGGLAYAKGVSVSSNAARRSIGNFAHPGFLIDSLRYVVRGANVNVSSPCTVHVPFMGPSPPPGELRRPTALAKSSKARHPDVAAEILGEQNGASASRTRDRADHGDDGSVRAIQKRRRCW